MSLQRRKLPIGIQNFAEIRDGDYYYVDKTPQLQQLIDEGKYYFLSRPRRFGKSLLIDTIKCLFEGREEWFRGLAIHPHWDWQTRYPVVHLSFGGGVVQSREGLERRIRVLLQNNATRLEVDCPDSGDISSSFEALIHNAQQHTGQRVVVLVDEYDKPILDNLGHPERALEIRDGLRNLYSVIKDSDAHIRFAMLTGVSRFSKVSLFSGLNNLNDITLDRAFATICGYADTDLDTVFAPELPGLDREQIRLWYNGYRWGDAEVMAVYNPFDVLLLFQKRQFRPWWFETATPTFLIDLLTERQTWLPELGQLQTDASLLSSFDVDYISTDALLFQTGYLTIAEENLHFGEYRYRLRYPNREVYQSLHNHLLQAWTGDAPKRLQHKDRLGELLLGNDFQGMEQLFKAFFASIPNDWYRKNPIAQYEGYYASVFYAWFASLGLDLTPEDSSHAGRLDLALRFNGQVYLFEFKVVDTETKGDALQQIKDRGYADKYRALGQSIHAIGVEFSRQQRNVVAFAVETLGYCQE